MTITTSSTTNNATIGAGRLKWTSSGNASNLNDKNNYNNNRQTRTSFVINYTLTVFAVASLILITAFTSLQAQEFAASGAGSNPQASAKRLLVATETSSADLNSATQDNNNDLTGAGAGSRKIIDSKLSANQAEVGPTIKGQQSGGGGGQATPAKPTRSPVAHLASSTPSEPITRSTRQTRATTKKHSTTVASASASSSSDDDITTPTTTTLEPSPALFKGSSPLEERADDAEQQPGKASTSRAKDKRKQSQAKQRREEEEENDEADEADEEKERERERARRRKLRNRLKTTSTTTTTTSTTTSTTRAPTSTVPATSTSSAASAELTSPSQPVSPVANKNLAHQHQNTSASSHQASSGFPVIIASGGASSSPASKQVSAPTEVPAKSSSTVNPESPAKLLNGTDIKAISSVVKQQVDQSQQVEDTKAVKPNSSMTTGDPGQATAAPILIPNQGDLVVGNKSLADLVRDAINEHANNNIKGLGDSMKHFRLICSVNTAPMVPDSELGSSSGGGGGGTFGAVKTNATTTTAQNANGTSAPSIGQPLGSLDLQGQNSNITSSTLQKPSHPSSNLTTKPVVQPEFPSNSSYSQTRGVTLMATKPASNSTTSSHEKSSLTGPDGGGVVKNRKSNNNYLDNSHQPGSVAQNSTAQSDHRNGNGSGNNNGKSITEIVRDMNSEHEKIEDHVKEQAESLRHFIVICSVSVVLATSFVVALITLLLK